MRAALVLCGCLVSCGPAAPADAQHGFIALAADFSGFTDWHKGDLGHHASDGLHVAGTRTLFINRYPPRGSKSFPDGTMVVKVVRGDDGTTQVFAMAKRGGEYNSDGAVGWEWFELASPDGPPVIQWRGTAPPISSVAYAGGAMTCNTCHQPAGANDSVLTPELSLESW